MYRKTNEGWMKHLDFMIIDMISLEIAFFFAYNFRRHGLFTNPLLERASYVHMVYILLLIDFVCIIVMQTFSGVIRRNYYGEFLVTIRQAIAVTLLSSFYLFTMKEGTEYSRFTLYMTGVLYFFISYISRSLWRSYLRHKKNHGNISIVIITTQDEVHSVLKNFQLNNYSKDDITGLVLTDGTYTGERIEEIEVVADCDSVVEYMLGHWVDEVFIGLTVSQNLRNELENTFIEMGITVHQILFSSNNGEEVTQRNIGIEQIGGYTVLTRSIRILSGTELVLKRILDIIGGVVGCLLTCILCLFVGPAIYKASPGPIFFSQKRIGKNGKIFKMYKFRSMYLDAEARKAELMDQNRVKDGFMFKMEYDPRIIGSEKGPDKGIGNFIRRTSIDEFPQFFNVLKGEMSLVGTRPPTLDEWEKYQNHHRARMATKPGITGMWQISGRSNITDFEEVVDLDMSYIENWSFGLDLKILAKTVLSVFKGEGAA